LAHKDPEADDLIRRALGVQPDATYLLVQQALLQEIALRNAQVRIAELQQRGQQAAPADSPEASSFLGGKLPSGSGQRGWANTPPPEPPPAKSWSPSPGAAAAGPAPGPLQESGLLGRGGQPSGFGSFLGAAGATAAGVAGGALLFQGLEHLIGPSGWSGLGGDGRTPEVIEENTTINQHDNPSAPDNTLDENAQDWGSDHADTGDTGHDPGDDFGDSGDTSDDSQWT
jgi:hypothetical protein